MLRHVIHKISQTYVLTKITSCIVLRSLTTNKYQMSENCSCPEGEENYLKKKVVIVGAGISGLACAKRLKEFGFHNVAILEARNWVGGRIHGMKFGSATLQTGAQWIHGQFNNSIYEIAESEGLIDSGAFNYSKAVRNFNNISNDEKEALTKLFEFLDEKMLHIPKVNAPGTSLLSYLDDQFQAFVSNIDNSSCDYFHSFFDWYCKTMLEINASSCLSLLSLNLYNNYEDCDGFPAVEVKGGFSSILNIFLNRIPADWIFTNKYVKQIDWSNFKKDHESGSIKYLKMVKVLCEDEKVFLADHVIVTIPLGCLKKHQSLFVPSLNKSKHNAIQYLGFGTVNKIYLQFTEPFWEGPAMFPVFRHQNEALKGWLQYISRFAYTPGCPDVLCGWIAGEGAIIMETLSEDEVLEGCMNILENILKKKLAKPSRIFRTSWHSDPLAVGSYSFLSIDCEINGISPSTLAEPEYADTHGVKHPVLLFAGEATHSCHFATVHGAYETGVREAERLFHYYRQ